MYRLQMCRWRTLYIADYASFTQSKSIASNSFTFTVLVDYFGLLYIKSIAQDNSFLSDRQIIIEILVVSTTVYVEKKKPESNHLEQ